QPPRRPRPRRARRPRRPPGPRAGHPLDRFLNLSHAGSVAYRPGTSETWADPWPMYADLRDHDPVHHVERSDGRDYYVLSRHADVLPAAVDTATYSSAQGLTVEYDELDVIGLADNRP